MKGHLREFLVLFVVQCVAYTTLCINYRAVAQADYMHSAVSDFAIASLQFFVIRRISEGKDNFARWAGYACGSVAGSFLGIWVSVTFLS